MALNIKDLSEYQNITDDSRKVIPGSIFIAIKGYHSDGHDFIKDAIKNGASLVISEKDYDFDGVNLVVVKDSRAAFVELAHRFYDLPNNVVAVTGTNGKTSVTYFYKQILEILGVPAASIGTLGVVSSKEPEFFNGIETLTTPGISDLYYILGQLKDKGIDNAIMEVSSHGLDQRRIDGVKIRLAAFTSFSQDHLDYHADMDDYFNAKLRLFSEVIERGGAAVINYDMSVSKKVVDACIQNKVKVITYGRKGGDIKINSASYGDGVTKVNFTLGEKEIIVDIPVLGDFQIDNIICAFALAINSGFSMRESINALESLHSVPGRLEVVGSNVIVDYAHTDDALEKAISSIRAVMPTKAKLTVVFGCGGDRDKAKRKLMGEVVARLADTVIVTDDNPRTEDPALIRKEVMKHCPKAIEVGNRKNAIKKAIEIKGDSDFVLIAGKGHEDYQIIGTTKHPFDDAKIAREFLKK